MASPSLVAVLLTQTISKLRLKSVVVAGLDFAPLVTANVSVVQVCQQRLRSL